MRKSMIYLLCLCASTNVVAQVDVVGKVIEKESDRPLTGATVIIKDINGKIKTYSTSKADGSFNVSLPNIANCRLEVAMMNFAKQSIPLDSVFFPLTIYLEPASTILKEVTVRADIIREQGDTITYNVSSFAQRQDRSIGDVLQRMPGINVEKNGKIQYQGEDINKFYIEGSDLLGGKYGIATNGISHEDVGAVEVMENHQPMQVLSGISFSDKAAINLKLKNKAKATWTFHGDAGGGYAWQPEGGIWDGEIFAMAVMPGFQNITTFKTNNIGDDLSQQATDFFASRRGTDLHSYVNISLPSVPNLSAKYTLFNRSALVSTNNLWKMGRGEVKAQIDYTFSRISSDAANITTYFLNKEDRIITENRKGLERSHALSGKFIYELNQKTAFVNNILNTDLGWDNIRLDLTGTLPNNQSAKMPDYYVSNDFKLIKRFKGNHLITFKSINEWESLPQTLSVSTGELHMQQRINDYAFYTNESAAYAFSLKGITTSLEGGLKGYLRTFRSELPNLPEILPGETTNVMTTDYFTVFITPKFEYWIRRVNFTLNAPISFATYHFDKAIANHNEMYFSPTFSINWRPNNRLSLGIRGGTGRSPMELNMIQSGIIMTDYRSFRCGVDDFYNSAFQNLSASIAYKNIRKGLFANVFLTHSWSHLPYTMAQQLFGEYVVYSYLAAKSDGKMLISSGNIGKTLEFIRGSANINASFSRRESHLLSEEHSVNSISTSWSAGTKINGTPIRWFSFDYRFSISSNRLALNNTKASWLSGMENKLLFNIMPQNKWEWHISGEHYRNELTSDNFKNIFLLDTKVVFKPGKRLEFSVRLSNIFNQKTYNYKSYNQLSSFESQRQLRGRELLFSISLRK